jgi:hypothetical protein
MQIYKIKKEGTGFAPVPLCRFGQNPTILSVRFAVFYLHPLHLPQYRIIIFSISERVIAWD